MQIVVDSQLPINDSLINDSIWLFYLDLKFFLNLNLQKV